MVVDSEGTFLSQRTHPRLGHISVQLGDTRIRLLAEECRQLDVELAGSEPIDVRVWNDALQVIDTGEETASWLSDFLDVEARLVRMGAASVRRVESRETSVSFADGYPYLLTTTGSLADLNARIEGPPVPMRAFRPNIVVSGATPWTEDDWPAIRIGDAQFEIAKPCERCKITTLDPTAPDRPRTDGEPLRTLATFRRRVEGGGVLFGQNLICRTPGVTVEVGDTVEVLE